MKALLEEDKADSKLLDESPSTVEVQNPGKFSDKVMPFFESDVPDAEKEKDLYEALAKFGHVAFR